MAGVGVDGCKGGWLYFRLARPEPEFGVAVRLADVLERSHEGDVILADVPVGLPDGGPERRCDREARAALSQGGRGSSVFPVPCREALAASSYEEAGRINQNRTGRGLSRQSWALAPRMREADDLMRASTVARERIRETHPEVLFWAFCDGRAMAFPKKSREGFLDRVSVLEKAWPGAQELAAAAFVAHGGFRVSRDDVVDALAAALAASWPDRLRTFPEEPEQDGEALTMEIVYAAHPVWVGPLPSAGAA